LGGMGNILGSVISATVLYIVPEMLRFLQDYRMIIYAVVLIVVMLFTWSPKVKQSVQILRVWLQDTFRKKKKNCLKQKMMLKIFSLNL
jgi:branched-chain amino acid transport system permease protein